MQLDVRIPRWLAVPLVILWAASLVVGTVAAAVSIKANLLYIDGQTQTQTSPPPPYPGQPATMEKPERPKQPEPGLKDDGKRKPIRPHR